VRGINFTTKIVNGDEVIDEDSIVIVVDETPPPKFLEEPPPIPPKETPPPTKIKDTEPPQKIKDPSKDWEKQIDDLKKKRDKLIKELNQLEQEMENWKIEHDNLEHSMLSTLANDMLWTFFSMFLATKDIKLDLPFLKGWADKIKNWRGLSDASRDLIEAMMLHTGTDFVKRLMKNIAEFQGRPNPYTWGKMLDVAMDIAAMPFIGPPKTAIYDDLLKGEFWRSIFHTLVTPKTWLKGAFTYYIAKKFPGKAGAYANAAFQAFSAADNAWQSVCVSDSKYKVYGDLYGNLLINRSNQEHLSEEIASLERDIKMFRQKK